MHDNKNNLAPLRNENETALVNHQLVAINTTYIQAATSDNTRLAYQKDIRHFMEWGGVLPTTADVIVNYLHQFAETLNARTLGRRLTALKNWHVFQDFNDPTSHALVRKTLTGIKNIHGQPKAKAPALQLEDLSKMVTYLTSRGYLIDLRNNAILQIGFFGAFRRSELVAIQYEDLHFVAEGVEILVPRSKTDQSGEGQVVAIPYGTSDLCPIKALKTWCEVAIISSGAIFRRVTKNDSILSDSIAGNHINLIIKSVAKCSQLPEADRYSSHSLRRGFATTASKKGAPFGAIMRQGRWRHEGTVLGYIEEGKRFDTNAAGIILNK